PSPFFARATQLCDVFGEDLATKYAVCMFPRVDRGFFLSDKDWTCYRRNYFQVSCTFSLLGGSAPQSSTGPTPRTCVVMDNGMPRTVSHFLIGIAAQVAASNRGVELVQHTPKRDKGPQITPQPQPARPSDSLGPGAQGVNTSATVCFERLQFKTATANNGKRRAAQQYYALEVELLAACDDGHCVAVATSTSSPIVVRGRSPGHYADTSRRRNASSVSSSGVCAAGAGPPLLSISEPSQASAPTDRMVQVAPAGCAETSAVAAAVAAAASGYGYSADSFAQALSGMAAPGTAVPPPHEILARAQGMAMDPFGINSLTAGSAAVAAAAAVAQQQQQQQQQQQALASMGTVTANAIASDVTLAAEAAITSTLAEATMAPTPSQLQSADGFGGGITIDPSPGDPLGSSDSLSLFQTQGLLEAQPPTPSVGSSTASLAGGGVS
ncbi:hypothetical protein H4R19_000869, partial [Coemansia spiralis]